MFISDRLLNLVPFANKMRQYARDIKTYLNLTVPTKISDMQLVQHILKNKLDAPLKQIRTESGKNAKGDRTRTRIYKWEPPKDVRSHIFQAWIERDELRAAEAVKASVEAARAAEWEVSGSPPIYIDITTADPVLGADPVVIPITPEQEIATCATWMGEVLDIEDEAEARINVEMIWSVIQQTGEYLGDAGANIMAKVIDSLTAGKQRRLKSWGLTG